MTLQPGTRLGPFEIAAPLGAGGMGEVYRARDPRLRRDVAIKVLPAALTADPERRRRFLREAHACAAVNHPNIAAIHEVDEADGVTFIVMELVEGSTLRSLLADGALPLGRALELATEIAEGLACAHGAGVIHRDLKPENIIVRPDDHPKILDFGLARLRDPHEEMRPPTSSVAETLTETLTREGRILGTPASMSPEQARGETVDARSDIFSFGIMLYEMVTGRAPFRGATPMDVLSAILRDRPVPPRDLNARVSPELQRVLDRCLEKAAGDRYQRADDLVSDLRQLRAGAVPVKRAGAVSGTHAARRPLGIALSVVILAALVTAWSVWGQRPRREAGPGAIRSLAVLPLETRSGSPDQDYFADGMTEALISELAKVRALKVISRRSVMGYKGAGKPLPEIARELGVDAVIEGSVLHVGDRVRISAQLIRAATDEHLWAEQYDRDLRDVLVLQSEVARAIIREIQVSLTPQEERRLASGPRVDPIVQEAYLKGLHYLRQEDVDEMKKSGPYFQQAVERDPRHAPAWVGLATYYRDLAIVAMRPDEAIPKARAALARALEIDDGLAEAHLVLAGIDLSEWNWSEARRQYERAIELNPSSADAHSQYGWFLMLVGENERALAEFERTAELNPLDLEARAGPAVYAFYTQQFDLAIERFDRLLLAAPDFATARVLRGASLVEQGRHDEGIAEMEEILRIAGGRNPILIGAIGYAHALAGRHDEARERLSDLEDLSQAIHVSPYYKAFVYGGLGEIDAAFEQLEEAFENRDSFLAKIRIDPILDPLRSDPRLEDLARRMGMP